MSPRLRDSDSSTSSRTPERRDDRQRWCEDGHELPATLEEWADFDFIGSSGPWMSPENERWIDGFRFYNRLAGGPESPLRRPFQAIARWRCKHDFYRVPVERAIVERLRPQPRLS